ncbi:MAG TPA: hypothetical protein VFE07_01930 [Marmoricola sp.]|jgi:hypothetical protein|nr:hypothetical protein [Marmoricola sp.]
MGTVVHPRGRLPARVYWFRRTMVVLSALALVFAIGRLLDGSAGGPPSGTAVDSASTTSPSTSSSPAAGLAGPMPLRSALSGGAHPTATGGPVVLAAPTGPCAVDEITITPTVPAAAAGGKVDLVLELTGIRPACTFSVTSKTLVAKVTSGKDRIWSTQDCPHAIQATSVVVRSAVPTKVVVPWSGRRSDDECSRSTSWALPGYYHLTAAAIGSAPGTAQFRLSLPPRPIVTKTAHPKKKKQAVVESGRRTG